MSSTLSYEISQTEFKREAVESVRKTFGQELGTGHVYRVSASFKTGSGWTSPFTMIYDTGAVISLVPALFQDLLGVERFARIKLSGISPDVEVGAKLTRTQLRLHDARGRISPKIDAWIAVADKNNVPLILGLKDISETHDFRVDSKKKTFHLEFRGDQRTEGPSIKETKMKEALDLVRERKVSVSRAARMAGTDYRTMLAALRTYNIPFPLSEKEMERELDELTSNQ